MVILGVGLVRQHVAQIVGPWEAPARYLRDTCGMGGVDRGPSWAAHVVRMTSYRPVTHPPLGRYVRPVTYPCRQRSAGLPTRTEQMKIRLDRWILAGGMVLMLALPNAVNAQSTGRIVGRVLNARSGQPLVTAQVYLERSEGALGGLTAVGGRFVIRAVPTGLHSVTVQLIGYATKTVTGVDVTQGQTTALDITLDEQAVLLAGITVTSTAERSSTTALLSERRTAAVVSDAIGAEQISRSPDGDAASALRRVPGLSVVDGKHAYVRGLGDRYTQTTLNGAPLASPEPDKKVIPLDVIPAGLLESIVTAKSYSPEQPGDYAGGLVQLRTLDFPTNMILNVSVSGEWNSVASFQNRLGYSGGGTDFFDSTKRPGDELQLHGCAAPRDGARFHGRLGSDHEQAAHERRPRPFFR